MSQEASFQTMCSSHFSANRRLDLYGLLLGSPWPVASPASVSLFPDFWIHCRRLAPCGLLLGPLRFCHFPVARFCLDPHGLLAPGWLFVPLTCFIICPRKPPLKRCARKPPRCNRQPSLGPVWAPAWIPMARDISGLSVLVSRLLPWPPLGSVWAPA